VSASSEAGPPRRGIAQVESRRRALRRRKGWTAPWAGIRRNGGPSVRWPKSLDGGESAVVRGRSRRAGARRGVGRQVVSSEIPGRRRLQLSCGRVASPETPVASFTSPKKESVHGQKTSRAPRPTKTWKDAFAGESQANRRYLYFAKHADVEGHPDIARPCSATPPKARPAALRHGHLDFLKQVATPPGDRQARSQHPRSSAERHPRRDLRVHRDVPGLRQGGAQMRGSRRLPSGSRPSRAPRSRNAGRFQKGTPRSHSSTRFARLTLLSYEAR